MIEIGTSIYTVKNGNFLEMFLAYIEHVVSLTLDPHVGLEEGETNHTLDPYVGVEEGETKGRPIKIVCLRTFLPKSVFIPHPPTNTPQTPPCPRPLLSSPCSTNSLLPPTDLPSHLTLYALGICDGDLPEIGTEALGPGSGGRGWGRWIATTTWAS